jgi:hypothetical protein
LAVLKKQAFSTGMQVSENSLILKRLFSNYSLREERFIEHLGENIF